MAVYAARQSSFTTGDTITAAHTNDEFNEILAAFHVSTGHTHDGSTAGDGGPLSTLYSNAISMGTNADTDIVLTFNANSNDGVITWMEDEDYFKFSDDILINSTERINFYDTGIYIYSSADGQLDLVADTEIQIAATTIDINGNVDVSGTITAGGTITGTLATAAQTNITSLGTLTALTVDDVAINGKVITMTGSASDTAVFTAGTDGTLSIVTTDAAAAAANIQITADGTAELAGTTVTLDSGGGITLDADNGTITFADGGVSLGTITSSGYSGTAATATVATTVTITDNESTNENNAIIFTAGGDVDGGNIGLESDGDLTYNPSTGLLSSTGVTASGTVTFGSISDGAITVTAFVDEDDMSTNSATLIPTQQSVKAYVDSEVSSAGSTWYLEDDDGTEVTINNAKEVKFIGSGVTTNWTDTSTGSDADPYDMTFTVDAAQTGITSLLATNIKIGEDDQTKIDFETANEIHLYADNAEQVYVADGIFGPQSDSDVDLGTTGVRWKDAFIDTITTTGTITAGGNITGTLATASQGNITTVGALDGGSITSNFGTIDTGASAITTTGLISGGSLDIDNVLINGTTIGHTDDTDLLTLASGALTVAGTIEGTTITASTALVPDASGGANLGSASLEWGDLYIADDKKIYLGSDQNLSIEYDEDGNDTTAIVAAGGVSMAPHGTSAGNGTELRFQELAANGAHYVGLKAPDSIAANKVWVLPNADGSASQVLKTDGSLALGWADLPGASGTQDLVADGSITAGKPVTMTSAGKAKQVSGTNEIDNNFLGLATESVSDGATCTVTTFGGVNSNQTDLVVTAAITGATEADDNGDEITIASDPATGTVMILYEDNDNSAYPTVRAGTISGVNITWGSATALVSATTNGIALWWDSHRSAFVSVTSSATHANDITVKSMTVSGTTITVVDSEEATNRLDDNIAQGIRGCFDSTANVGLLVMSMGDSPTKSSFTAIQLNASRVITIGTELVTNDKYGEGSSGSLVHDVESGVNILITKDYYNSTLNNLRFDYPMVIPITISGTTCTLGMKSRIEFSETYATGNPIVVYDSNAKATVAFFEYSNILSYSVIKATSGGILQPSAAVTIETTREFGSGADDTKGCFNTQSGKIVIAYRNSSTTTTAYVRSGRLFGTTITWDAEQALASGGGAIKNLNVANTLSTTTNVAVLYIDGNDLDEKVYTVGVDAGTNYFATNDGTVVAGGGAQYIGQSISATKLAIGNTNTGTDANNLVQLDSYARLPAVDGSRLTNLPNNDVRVYCGSVDLRNEIGSALSFTLSLVDGIEPSDVRSYDIRFYGVSYNAGSMSTKFYPYNSGSSVIGTDSYMGNGFYTDKNGTTKSNFSNSVYIKMDQGINWSTGQATWFGGAQHRSASDDNVNTPKSTGHVIYENNKQGAAVSWQSSATSNSTGDFDVYQAWGAAGLRVGDTNGTSTNYADAFYFEVATDTNKWVEGIVSLYAIVKAKNI